MSTEVISAHGALLESTEPLTAGATYTAVNERTKVKRRVWVLWARPGGQPGRFTAAVEFLEDGGRGGPGASAGAALWGADYEP